MLETILTTPLTQEQLFLTDPEWEYTEEDKPYVSWCLPAYFFNIDIAFGTHVNTFDNDDWINIYVYYYPDKNTAEMHYVYTYGDGKTPDEEYKVILDSVTQAALNQKARQEYVSFVENDPDYSPDGEVIEYKMVISD